MVCDLRFFTAIGFHILVFLIVTLCSLVVRVPALGEACLYGEP
jgi:hypothetical protein